MQNSELFLIRNKEWITLCDKHQPSAYRPQAWIEL